MSIAARTSFGTAIAEAGLFEQSRAGERRIEHEAFGEVGARRRAVR